METVNLTEGAITMISNGASQAELKPTLQITDLKMVQTKQAQQNDRYRLVLSDGSHLQQAMLGTQLNHLVKDDVVKLFSVIQLLQYTCTRVQGRMIIIILELVVIKEHAAPIGNPAPGLKSPNEQPKNVSANTPSYTSSVHTGGTFENPNSAAPSLQIPKTNQAYGGSHFGNYNSGTYSSTKAPEFYGKAENGVGVPRSGLSNGPQSNANAGIHNIKLEISQPHHGSHGAPHLAYQQQQPFYNNRGPVAKNEAAPRIIPIAALNPYQGRWTIKARVTSKGELRHYNNPRGDGKVFSFDLLDSNGGEIKVTCFNAVADQFYHQIEAGKVYLISRGNLKPAQKAFNHLHNDLEIHLESSSTVQLCVEDDNAIPRQQFHFCPISDVEGLDNNSVVDVIGVVSSITPTSSIMRKNGTETQKRSLQLKDMSGRSVELTLWGNFCNSEGQKLQNMCDSGIFPVLAIKTARVSEFNGKAVGTISTSQLFIEPDFPEARRLREWFDKEGKNAPFISLSREMSGGGKTDVAKAICQIKDERLGTSEKPDWIIIPATIIYLKSDNFCYTACPIMSGERPCSKKVTNNGDGKWRCEKCNQSMDECDYRYILQIQIEDHTGITWVTAFQEAGEEIMGISAKDLHYMKYEKQDDEGFSKVLRQVLFSRYVFKLKVKEETFSDEQRVKSTVVKADKMNYPSHSRFLLDLMQKFKSGNDTSSPSYPNFAAGNSSNGNVNSRQAVPTGSNYSGTNNHTSLGSGLRTSQVGQYGNQSSTRFPHVASVTPTFCNSCGSTGHISANCPSIMSAPGQSIGESFNNRGSHLSFSGNTGGECYKCHQVGHWARDCPGLSTVPPAYGATGVSSVRYGAGSKHQFGGF